MRSSRRARLQLGFAGLKMPKPRPWLSTRNTNLVQAINEMIFQTDVIGLRVRAAKFPHVLRRVDRRHLIPGHAVRFRECLAVL